MFCDKLNQNDKKGPSYNCLTLKDHLMMIFVKNVEIDRIL